MYNKYNMNINKIIFFIIIKKMEHVILFNKKFKNFIL